MSYIDRTEDNIVYNADYLKIVVGSYYRFKQHYAYTCTEFEYMDVCACNGNFLTEIECKISKRDLLKEFDKPKHCYYSGQLKSRTKIIPNRFYIAVPEKLFDEHIEHLINQLNPKYGIILVNHTTEPRIYKNSGYLHNNKVKQDVIDGIVKRLSSECIGLREKLYDERYINKNKKTREI